MQEIAPYRRELSEKQATFVKAFVASGDACQSALVAGYSPATARNPGTQLLESPAVVLAITQAAKLRLARGVPLALDTIEHLMKNAQSERVRLESAKAWLDRAGLVAPAASKDDSNAPEKPLHELSIEELRAMVARAQAYFERGEAEIANRAKPINATGSDPVADLTGLTGDNQHE